jgi:hypothetical protein
MAISRRPRQNHSPAFKAKVALPPDPLHALVFDHPAQRIPQHGGNLPVAQPAVLPGQGHKVVRQLLLVFPTPRDLALCRPVLAERRTSFATTSIVALSGGRSRETASSLNAFPY